MERLPWRYPRCRLCQHARDGVKADEDTKKSWHLGLPLPGVPESKVTMRLNGTIRHLNSNGYMLGMQRDRCEKSCERVSARPETYLIG